MLNERQLLIDVQQYRDCQGRVRLKGNEWKKGDKIQYLTIANAESISPFDDHQLLGVWPSSQTSLLTNFSRDALDPVESWSIFASSQSWSHEDFMVCTFSNQGPSNKTFVSIGSLGFFSGATGEF